PGPAPPPARARRHPRRPLRQRPGLVQGERWRQAARRDPGPLPPPSGQGQGGIVRRLLLLTALALACLAAVPAAALADQSLEVRAEGNGSGTAASRPTGISCGAASGECVASFADGTAVTLTATLGAGTETVHWTGCDTVTEADACTVTMNAARQVSATFVL